MKYRIIRIEYPTHEEYWVQRRKFIFWWQNTTIPYFSNMKSAEDHYKDLVYKGNRHITDVTPHGGDTDYP